jgi:acyl-CoA synthetase (AMP-forming)/AMP-acid ligase II
VLAETATEAARRFGDRPALVAEAGWSLSYADLDRLSDEVAAGLARRGVGEGDLVALVLPAVPEHTVCYVAAAKLGAVTAGVNARLAAPEREAVLSTAGPAVVVATGDLAPAGRPGTAEVVVCEPSEGPGDVLGGLRVPGAAPPALPPDPDRPVAVVFTSGTTGSPKGAVYTSRQLAFITQTDVGPNWGGGGRSLGGSAPAHLGPMTKLAGQLRRGNTTYLLAPWRAARALRLVAEHRVASVGGVPAQLALMLEEPTFDRCDLRCVRAIVIGGGPATPALLRAARARFAAPVAVRYSCTEAGLGTGTALDDPPADAEESVGRPLPGVTVRVVGADGRPLPGGEVGEVVLSSPAVMAGYWRDEAATAAALAPGGGVRTGDLGWVDERGRLHLAGRTTERYVRGGDNVHPLEVEAVLADHPDLSAVAVVARADPVMGEVGVAVVVPRPGREPPSLASLRGFAEGRLARHKLPEDVVAVPALPLTAMDKVDRRALSSLVRGSDRRERPGGPRAARN